MNSILNSENQKEKKSITIHKFLKEVLEGLKNSPKKLSSKYFYDSIGDNLFQQIMAMQTYYLTNCELDIFKNKTADIAHSIKADKEPFDLIELGAGDAMKSSYLLRHLIDQDVNFSYMPIDISGNILSLLKTNLNKSIPNLEINCLKGEYFEMIDQATALSSRRKVVLFLGSNIGNMELEEATQFCTSLRQKLNVGDYLVMGFDLKKHPQTILNAYDDPTGITAKFNLNLLARINRELEANFDLNLFEHYQTYDPLNGACRSYLISLAAQQVIIDNQQISFLENEPIYMEISQKFSDNDIRQLAHQSGFSPISELYDSKNWFVDVIWQVK
ncbi:L-histidine N(alpha)-methyltransferase [Sphingobacterium faecium]|uniref:L-histidine N(alpha)-methyltransferase n=1 Tax=Sphingobacterium faecium TaxID=34087 RepID=UPI003208EA2A